MTGTHLRRGPGEHADPCSRRRKSESGQAALLIVLAMGVFLLGAVGLAIDGSMLYGHRQMAQAAADAAVQSGMLSIFHGTNATASNPFATGTTPTPYSCTTTDGTTPCVYARLNGFGGVASDTVSISFPTSVTGVTLVSGNTSAMSVRVQRNVNAALMGMLGFRTFTVGATATAALVKMPMTNCITALDSSASGAFSVSGNANLNLTTCGIAIDSSSLSALRVNGNISLTATDIDVVGNVSRSGNVTISPSPTTGAPSVSDPLGSVPAPSYSSHCDHTNQSYSGNQTVALMPGTYCGGISFTGNVNATFTAGTYILLGGGMSAAGNVNLTGSNLTFYNTYDGTHSFSPISLSGNLNMTLSATTSGSLAGMLFFRGPNSAYGKHRVVHRQRQFGSHGCSLFPSKCGILYGKFFGGHSKHRHRRGHGFLRRQRIAQVRSQRGWIGATD